MTHATLGLFLILKNKSPAIHPQSEQNAQAAQPSQPKKQQQLTSSTIGVD
jgi:hypothetical protein